MSNSEQNSLEWLIDELEKNNMLRLDLKTTKALIVNKAQSMYDKERAQLSAGWAKLREQTRETAMHIGFARGFECGIQCFEDYHEELDKTDLDEDEFTRNYITDRFEETYGGNNES